MYDSCTMRLEVAKSSPKIELSCQFGKLGRYVSILSMTEQAQLKFPCPVIIQWALTCDGSTCCTPKKNDKWITLNSFIIKNNWKALAIICSLGCLVLYFQYQFILSIIILQRPILKPTTVLHNLRDAINIQQITYTYGKKPIWRITKILIQEKKPLTYMILATKHCIVYHVFIPHSFMN